MLFTKKYRTRAKIGVTKAVYMSYTANGIIITVVR